MERIVNASGEEVATSSSILSLPPATSSSSTSSFNPVSTSSSIITTKATSLGDVSKPTRLGHRKILPQPPVGDVKDSLKLLDDAINFYENDTTSSMCSSTANLNFDGFSSSQGEGETTEEEESESNDIIEFNSASATLPSRRKSVKLTPLAQQSSQMNTRSYFSQQEIPSVEMSRSKLEERIEARIRRNRIRPTIRPSILLDSSNPDPTVFSRK